MKTSLLRLVAGVVCCALLAGCNGSFFSPENAIKAPNATGIYRGVQDALEASVGEQVVLKYPLVEGTTTAFYPKDLDGDGIQEMLTFYRFPSEGEVTRIALLCNVEGSWDVLQTIDPMGNQVVNVDFCDLDGDKQDEICIGWSVSTSRSNLMTVYQTENMRLVQRASEPYTRSVVCDIDGDNISELGLANLNVEVNTSTVSFFKIKQNVFSMIGSLSLDSGVSAYGQMTAARMDDGTFGVYLDAYKGTDHMITELIYFSDGKLYNPFGGSLDGSNISTLRYCTLNVMDVNNDGYLEIPFMEILPGYLQEDLSLLHHAIRWRQYNHYIGETVRTWWYNSADGYYLEIPSEHDGKYTVVMDELEGSFGFYLVQNGLTTQRLFRIKKFTSSEYASITDPTYSVLYNDSASTWAVSIDVGGPSHLTAQAIQQAFHLIIK